MAVLVTCTPGLDAGAFTSSSLAIWQWLKVQYGYGTAIGKLEQIAHGLVL